MLLLLTLGLLLPAGCASTDPGKTRAIGRQCRVHTLSDVNGLVVTGVARTPGSKHSLLVGADRRGEYGVPMVALWTAGQPTIALTRRFDRGAEGTFEAVVAGPASGWVAAATARGPRAGGLGGDDAWLVVLDRHGDVGRQRVLGGPYADSVSGLVRRGNGVWMIGTTGSKGTSDTSSGWIVSLDDTLATTWERTFGKRFEQGFTRARTYREGVLVLGWQRDKKAPDSLPWLLALGADGTTRWEKRLTGLDGARPVAFGHLRPDGGFWLAGRKGRRAWVARMSPTGDLVWQRAVGPLDAGQVGWVVRAFDDGDQRLLFGGSVLRSSTMLAGFFFLGLDKAKGYGTAWARLGRAGLPLGLFALPYRAGHQLLMSASAGENYSVHTIALDRNAQRLDCN